MVVYRKESNLDPLTGTTAVESPDETVNDAKKVPNANSLMVPRAVLTSRPNSHPFHERQLFLDQPAKIGRSVARCRAGQNNAIFDCKVLSRNHALLWYENGKFYLQDTKSSNGTFVNNQRLSKGSEESPAREVCSGDIVQFGVDVVENSRKVVHGCIVATLRLFLPDGKESKASPTTAVIPLCSEASVSSQEIYQLAQFLQEALHREQVLETKLGTLQKVIANTQDESDIGWKALIEEDRLLSRIETLEGQLQTCGKNVTEEKLREEVLKLQDEKAIYQNAAKESINKILQEKLEMTQNVQNLENSLSNSETECNYLREVNKTQDQAMQELLEKNNENDKEIVELTKKLQEAEEKLQEALNQAGDEKMELEEKIELLVKKEDILTAKNESLESEKEFLTEQLESLTARFEVVKHGQSESILEQNGMLSPCEDELETTDKDALEKKKLIQGLTSQVCRRVELELQQVEDSSKNEETQNTVDNNTDWHTNGDIRQNDHVNQLQAEIQQLKKCCDNYDFLKCKGILLQELLAEARESKKSVDAELTVLKGKNDEVQNQLRKLKDDNISLNEQLESALQQLKDLTERLEKESFESKMKSVERGELDLTLSEKEKSSELSHMQGELTTMQRDLKKCQEELDHKKKDNVKQSTKIQWLETETRRLENETTRLDADNKTLREKSAKLEEAKIALENTSDNYWKDKYHTVEARNQGISEEAKLGQEQIILLKEMFAKAQEEKTCMKKENAAFSEKIKLMLVQSKVSCACCAVPIIVLVLAAILALYPTLAHFTATADHT